MNWKERIEGMKQESEHPAFDGGWNQAIDEIIPIIAEEMQKQREEVIGNVFRRSGQVRQYWKCPDCNWREDVRRGYPEETFQGAIEVHKTQLCPALKEKNHD